MTNNRILSNSIWPNTEGPLGKNKAQIPDGVTVKWPEGDALVHNFVYKDGKLVGFVDSKALTVNETKSTIINYDYFDIELPFTEGEIAITRGERSKYFNVRYNPINDDNVVITLKYKGCKTVDDVKAVDPDYLTNDIVDGVWSEGLGDLVNAYNVNTREGLFEYCSHLESFSSDLSSLTNANNMFFSCENLTSFSSELPSLTDGCGMFEYCSKLTSFYFDLPNLTDGTEMFAYCYQIESFNCDLSSLTIGDWMFKSCTKLTSFSSDLPNLTDGEMMFNYTNLTTFSSDLSSLTNANNMFSYCSQLESFFSDLSNLTNGRAMFYNTLLESFNCDLSSLTDGRYMFQDCNNLTSFTSDLPSLTNGSEMFSGCKLDTSSVQHIADNINTPSSKGTIHIGIGNSTPNEQEEIAFNKIVSKNWTVYVGVNGGSSSQWDPTSLIPIDGEEPTNPIPFYAKPAQSDEEHAKYIDSEGNFYNILGGNYIYGDDLSTYGMFTCEEDAAANMRLTKIEKKDLKSS